MARLLLQAIACAMLAMQLQGQDWDIQTTATTMSGHRDRLAQRQDRVRAWGLDVDPTSRPDPNFEPVAPRSRPPMPPPGGLSAHATSMLGDVARTTANGTDARTGKTFLAGENIYGPFDNGFSSAQDHHLRELGCAPAKNGHVDGGYDIAITEQMIAFQCGITLPRVEEDKYISILDECGGHTDEYHFHTSLSCLYNLTSGGHSSQVGEALDGKFIYGKWENSDDRQFPQLDACGGHYGLTPDSPIGPFVYHYHVQDRPPFTVGCYGPNDDGSLVTVAQCRSFYPGCDGDFLNVTTPSGARPYDQWCPCYDANGVNTGIAFSELAAFTTTTTTAIGLRGWSLIRFVPLKLRTNHARIVQIAEIAFRFRGVPVSLADATIFLDAGQSPAGEDPSKAIDGLSQTKWVDMALQPLTIRLPEPLPVDSYTLITANDYLARDPVQWRLEGSNDGGISFEVLHEVLADHETPTDRGRMLEWFRIPICLQVVDLHGGQSCLSPAKLISQGLAFPSTPPY